MNDPVKVWPWPEPLPAMTERDKQEIIRQVEQRAAMREWDRKLYGMLKNGG